MSYIQRLTKDLEFSDSHGLVHPPFSVALVREVLLEANALRRRLGLSVGDSPERKGTRLPPREYIYRNISEEIRLHEIVVADKARQLEAQLIRQYGKES